MRIIGRALLIIAVFAAFLDAPAVFADGAVTPGSFDAISTLRPAPSMPQPKVAVVAPEHDGLFEAVNETTYVVGPGDYFQITYGGKAEMAFVNSEGIVVIGTLPALSVGGKTLLQAKQEIRRSVSAQFKGDRIDVTLAQAKVFQVSITGEVGAPGIYTVATGTRVASLLDRVGGFSFLATRGLRITSSSGATRELDLGEYYRTGDLSQNPDLNQGDRVFAPSVDLSGNVVYVRNESGTRVVQALPGENLEQILRRFQNFRNGWEWLDVRIYQDGRYRETVERKDASAYIPHPGDVLEVQSSKNVVFVGGMVLQPGYFAYNPSFNVQDYIALAGVTVGTGNATRGVEVIDAQGKVRKIDAKSGPLHPGDHIVVPRSGEAATRDYVGLFSSISGVAVALATLYVLIGTQ